MQYQWLSAQKIHDGKQFLTEETFIKVASNGIILDIASQKPNESIVYYEGCLCPGWINVHCHLELSFMLGLVPPHSGLINFLSNVVQLRKKFSDEDIQHAIQLVADKAYNNGIVAFGDIANGTDSVWLKNDPRFYFHTFVEALGKIPENVDIAFAKAFQTFQDFKKAAPLHNVTITPHAPYSISNPLFDKIVAMDPNAVISIHSQECAAETELFEKGTGLFIDFFKGMGIPIINAAPHGKSSVAWILEHIADSQSLILVHNTFIQAADVALIKNRKAPTFFCLCPNANLYIENRLPPIEWLAQQKVPICIGTDSLASNEDICIFSELKTIRQNYESISWENLIQWATYQGACALQIENQLGLLRVGTRPGIVNINATFDSVNRVV